jgi:glycosyltransferase involved in cell wall biosynthesis
MKTKIKILFVIESLYLGGGSERSFLSLLKYIEEEKYDIELQLIYHGGELEKLVPSHVNILPPLKYIEYMRNSYFSNMKNLKSCYYFKSLFAKLAYSLKIRTRKLRASEKSQFLWDYSKKLIKPLEKEYDIAIAFAQNIPTFFVVDKIKAKKKVAWVNVTMKFPKANAAYNNYYYEKLDKIVCITEEVSNHHQAFFPTLKTKFRVINNIIDYESIIHLANEEEIKFKANTFNILTAARFSHQKGYDILIEACNVLKLKNLKFHWFILGGGGLEEEIKLEILNKELKNHITLLGVKENPYPYFKAADLYVHTARHEGFGRTLAEARLLNIPVVTTCFDTVFMQMIHEKNGLVTDMNSESVANAIERMMTDKNIYNSIVDYLKQETKQNLNSVKKFDDLIDELII